MIKSHWLELPISRTNFHGPKDVRAIEVRMYMASLTEQDLYCLRRKDLFSHSMAHMKHMRKVDSQDYASKCDRNNRELAKGINI